MPPGWLAGATLPVDRLGAGTPLFRVHRREHDPVFFGPGKGVAPTYRFDSPTGAFGVLYAGLSLEAAIAETLLRNPHRRMVGYSDLADRASCVLTCARELRVVRLFGAGLQVVGCDNAISTGPYDVCGAWADALWAHPERPDGIAYQSRHDPGAMCIALFEREGIEVRASESVPLTEQLPRVAAILGVYGKSIVDVPR